jgi:arylsulfatase A-like enzyme
MIVNVYLYHNHNNIKMKFYNNTVSKVTNSIRLFHNSADNTIYDNTIIMFTSDNGSSEPIEMRNAATTGATVEQTQAFFSKFNN